MVEKSEMKEDSCCGTERILSLKKKRKEEKLLHFTSWRMTEGQNDETKRRKKRKEQTNGD